MNPVKSGMDYLRDCMNDVGNPPIDVMNKSWCIGCGNRGCERAGMNQSVFDKRVKNWKETLFTNVPRAADDDHSYDNIRARTFSPIGQPEAPRTAVFVPGVPPPEQGRPAMAQPSAFVGKDPPPAPEMSIPAIDERTVAQTAAVVTPRIAPPGNTTFEQGMVLNGGPRDQPGAVLPAEPAPSTSPGPGPGPGKTFILEDD